MIRTDLMDMEEKREYRDLRSRHPEMVSTIHDLYCQGLSVNTIADMLSEKGNRDEIHAMAFFVCQFFG